MLESDKGTYILIIRHFWKNDPSSSIQEDTVTVQVLGGAPTAPAPVLCPDTTTQHSFKSEQEEVSAQLDDQVFRLEFNPRPDDSECVELVLKVTNESSGQRIPDRMFQLGYAVWVDP